MTQSVNTSEHQLLGLHKDDYDTHMHNACKDFQIVYVVHQSDLQLKYEQNT